LASRQKQFPQVILAKFPKQPFEKKMFSNVHFHAVPANVLISPSEVKLVKSLLSSSPNFALGFLIFFLSQESR